VNISRPLRNAWKKKITARQQNNKNLSNSSYRLEQPAGFGFRLVRAPRLVAALFIMNIKMKYCGRARTQYISGIKRKTEKNRRTKNPRTPRKNELYGGRTREAAAAVVFFLREIKSAGRWVITTFRVLTSRRAPRWGEQRGLKYNNTTTIKKRRKIRNDKALKTGRTQVSAGREGRPHFSSSSCTHKIILLLHYI